MFVDWFKEDPRLKLKRVLIHAAIIKAEAMWALQNGYIDTDCKKQQLARRFGRPHKSKAREDRPLGGRQHKAIRDFDEI